MQMMKVGLRLVLTAGLLAACLRAAPAAAQERFKETRSRQQYAHYIQLYDAKGLLIDPTSPDARPYSPMQTCKKCHDYKQISHGWHFNAADAMEEKAAASGDKKATSQSRPGEPWMYVDKRTGTSLPVSLRNWPGTYKPWEVGLTRFRTVAEFGRHMPGGGIGEQAYSSPSQVEAGKPENAGGATLPQPLPGREGSTEADANRWAISGNLEIDCMICHSATRQYSHEHWIKQVNDQNFAWAATYAMGLASVKGSAKLLPDTFDPAKPAQPNEPGLPKVKYDASKFNAEHEFFFDVIRKPTNNACYACHSTNSVGPGSEPKWVHDQDVHLRAGIACADCHRNDLGHHTVRGYEGEISPTKLDVTTLSCRGCHMDDNDATSHGDLGGRLGAPKPLHKGLPPIHLDKMSCTSCHSGPLPRDKTGMVQTAMAHSLGLALQTREDDDLPLIAQPVLMRREKDDKIYPYRMTWPAFWGWREGDTITPIDPNIAYRTLRGALRIRADFRAETSKAALTDEDRKAVLGADAGKEDKDLAAEQKEKLAAALKKKQVEVFRANLPKGLEALAKTNEKATPVYVSGGKVYELDPAAKDKLKVTENHAAAKPYAWPLAHDVRPARQSLGATGCTECHAKDSPVFYSTVAALGPAPDDAPPTTAMHALQGQDADLLEAWEQSFGGRPIFKWVGFVAVGCVALVLLLFVLLALNGVVKCLKPKQAG